jgi:hypothetical protein
MNAWDKLPNAKHINWVLSSVKTNPEAWEAAYDVAWYAAWYAARTATYNTARTAAWTTAWYAARSAAYDAAWSAAWSAITALIAFDHCEKYLNMTPDELMIWWKLSGDPACVLLMPMIKVKNERMG